MTQETCFERVILSCFYQAPQTENTNLIYVKREMPVTKRSHLRIVCYEAGTIGTHSLLRKSLTLEVST